MFSSFPLNFLSNTGINIYITVTCRPIPQCYRWAMHAHTVSWSWMGHNLLIVNSLGVSKHLRATQPKFKYFWNHSVLLTSHEESHFHSILAEFWTRIILVLIQKHTDVSSANSYLAPWSRHFLEKLMVTQMVTIIPDPHETQRFFAWSHVPPMYVCMYTVGEGLIRP
jgi:hypothetical protein